jgi:hypothetical protein
MSARSALVLLVLVALAFAAGSAPVLAGIDYIGLRLSLPLGRLPFFVGIEVGMRLPVGWGMVSLLLTQDGRTLLIGSLDWALGAASDWGSSVARVSLGLSYLDLGAPFPSPLFGGGVGYLIYPFPGCRAQVAAEILYPVAFGPPLVSLGGGWSLR